MDEITLYLGTLAAIGIGGLILIVVILTRGSGGGGKKPQQRLRNDYKPTTTPRVQVVLGDPDEGLIWVVNGRATRELSAITDPTERRALEILVERVQAVDLPFELLDVPEMTPLSPVIPSQSPAESDTPPSPDNEPPLSETPAIPPPLPSPPAYEDELAKPFLSRLRDSLFGVDYETKPSQRMYTPRPVPSPAKGKAKEIDEDSTFGLPRFEELNTLLQQRLAMMPDAPTTTIRQGRNGMLEILVQGRVYDHIDEVPDETVRQAMREAVAIWNGS